MAHLLRLPNTVWLVLLLAACTQGEPAPDPLELGRQYVDSAAFRRELARDSLVNPDNSYSNLRLGKFGRAWDDLPVSTPQVRPVTSHGLGEPVDDWRVEWTHEGLLAAGEQAFWNYPMRHDPRLEVLRGATEPTAGFWVDGRVGGLVDVAGKAAWTCSTCHAKGLSTPGVPNGEIDLAELYRLGGRANTVVDGWRAGTLDPSADATDNPSTIGDLRAVRFQSHLHWAATVRNSMPALAMRVESLLIVSAGEASRPPRDLAFALAYYLWNLGEAPELASDELFERNCATCHRADGSVGPPLAWPGEHPGRGTGLRRVPSLVGVADRQPLLHDGSVASLRELLETTPPLHPFGKALSAPERERLLTYLADF